MKRTLILMLALSCLIAVTDCGKKDKGSDAGSDGSSSASAQSYSGASLEEVMKEIEKLAEDYQTGKISFMEYSKRATAINEQIAAIEKAAAEKAAIEKAAYKIKKRGDAKQGTLHILNIPLYQYADDSYGGEFARPENYVIPKVKVRGIGYISVTGMAIKDDKDQIVNRGFALANDDEKVPTPSGDSITVKLISSVSNDEYIDFEDGVYMVNVSWSPQGSMLFCNIPVTFKGGVGTADCKLWLGNLYQ